MLFFRIWVTAKGLTYMAIRLPAYFWSRILGKQKIWLEEHLYLFAKYSMKIMRINPQILGQEQFNKITWDRPVFVVVNHSSYSDIPLILLATRKILGFLAKVELTRIPILHFWMRELGCIFIKRGSSGAARAVIREIEKRRDPVRLVLFPEGTRSKDGTVHRFRSGGLKIAWEAKAWILPVSIHNSRKAWEDRRSFEFQKVRIDFLEPIDCALQQQNEMKQKDILDQIERSIQKKIEALNTESF